MLAVKITLAIALILSIVVPFGAYAIGEKSRGHYKKSLAINIISFFGILIISQIVMKLLLQLLQVVLQQVLVISVQH